MTVAEGSTVVRVLNGSCFPLLPEGKVGTSATDALRLILSRVTENGQPARVFNFASFPPLP
jgi:hypothetical protein